MAKDPNASYNHRKTIMILAVPTILFHLPSSICYLLIYCLVKKHQVQSTRMFVWQLTPIEVQLSWQRQRQTSRSRKFMARSLILPTLPILNITALMSKGGIGSQRPSTSVKQQLVNQHTEDDENDVTEDDDVIRKASEQMLNCSEVNSTDWSETTGINEEFGLLRRRQSRGI